MSLRGGLQCRVCAAAYSRNGRWAHSLREAMRVLKGVEDISICRLTESDVVRHVLVQRIIKAYEEDEERRGPKKDRRERP